MRTSVLLPACCMLFGLRGILPAQSYYQTIRSFGFPDLLGQAPQDRLIQGSDGALYGTARSGPPSVAGTAFRLNRDGTGYHVLHGFGSTPADGIAPSGLMEASDGLLYGTTYSGGSNTYYGTVFKIAKDGTGYSILHSFPASGDGQNPNSGLIEGTDGSIYGTTLNGGTYAFGTLFKINRDGSAYAILHMFSSAGTEGYWPRAGIMKGSDGLLYGTTERGGAHGGGTIFRLANDGTGFTVIHDFAGAAQDGAFPHATLIEASDGLLYGTTQVGGTTNSGTVFKLDKNGNGYTVLHSFNIYSLDASYPEGSLAEGTDGALYGTTSNAGAGSGTAFKLNKDGTGYRLLHSFGTTPTDGASPFAGLLALNDGTLWGTTRAGGLSALGTIFKMSQDGLTYSNLWSFSYAGGDGMNPTAPLVEANNGALYGTTGNGGTGTCPSGCGTLFKLNKDGTGYGLLHSFGNSAHDGSDPEGGLLVGQDGGLYGTTYSGGSNNFGTVFRINGDGTGYTILHDFVSGEVDGQSPKGELFQASDGLLYGTTYYGGSNYSGTVFRLGTNGSGHTILHHFSFNGGDGENPSGGVIEGSDGVLYGSTPNGGSNGHGTIFKLNRDGSGYGILHNFNYDGVDGISPAAGLIEGRDGMLYGTTTQGGTNSATAAGTVFTISRSGTGYRLLRTFSIYGGDGQNPGRLVEGNDGALYGATAYGGYCSSSDGCGTIFRINKDGTGYAMLHSFDTLGGQGPRCQLFKASDGKLYGTTTYGGASGLGTIFNLLPPPKMLGVAPLGVATEVSFTGLSGARYEISRSTNLINWSVISDFIMPESTSLTIVDTAAPKPAAFYRAMGIP